MAASDWFVVRDGLFCWKSSHLIWWSVIGGLLAGGNLVVALVVCVYLPMEVWYCWWKEFCVAGWCSEVRGCLVDGSLKHGCW